MLSTPHLLVGAAIVHSIPEPAISLPAAFLSHFVLDAAPHWDGSPKAPFSKKLLGGIAADYTFGMALVLLVSIGQPNQLLILLGAFLATLPDFIMAFTKHFPTPLGRLPLISHFNHYHRNIQTNVRLSRGIASSLAVSLAAIIFLAR
jgi:hypothetical protein